MASERCREEFRMDSASNESDLSHKETSSVSLLSQHKLSQHIQETVCIDEFAFNLIPGPLETENLIIFRKRFCKFETSQ